MTEQELQQVRKDAHDLWVFSLNELDARQFVQRCAERLVGMAEVIITLQDQLAGMPLSGEEIGAIEAREQAASKGPWNVIRCPGADETKACEIHYGLAKAVIADTNREECQHHIPLPDAFFIAHARSDIPALLSFVRFLQALIHDLTEESTAYRRGREDEEKRWRGEVEVMQKTQEGEGK